MKYKFVIILVCILFVSFLLRFLGYENYPKGGTSFDEYGNTFVGLSLLRIGYPVGFTIMNGYEHIDFNNFILEGGNKIVSQKIAYPYLDHPPLICFITGGWNYLRGVRVFNEVRLALIRQPMIFLGVLSVFALYLFAKENFGQKVALWSAFLYGVMPFTVVSSRTAQAENLFIPIVLFSLYFVSKYVKKKNFSDLIWCCLFMVLAMLTKVSVVFLFATILVILIKNKKFLGNEFINSVMWVISFAVFGVLCFVVYGMAFDWQIFKNIFLSHANRFYGLGMDAWLSLMRNESITIYTSINSGWNMIMWFSLIILFFKRIKNKYILIIPVLVYLAFYILLGSWRFGWYTFPFYPFLTIILVLVFFNFKNTINNLFGKIVVLFIPATTMLSVYFPVADLQFYKNVLRFPIFIFLILLLILKYTDLIKPFIKQKILLYIFNILFLFCILESMGYVLQLSGILKLLGINL